MIASAYKPADNARRYRLPAGILIAVTIATAATDFLSFFAIVLDAQHAGAYQPIGVVPGLLDDIGIASVVPLCVMVVAEVGGHCVARLLAEPRGCGVRRGRASIRSTAQRRHATLWIAAVGVLASLSFAFGLQRFRSTGGDHTGNVETVLMATVVALLPVLAFVAAAARHDFAQAHHATVTRGWEIRQVKLTDNQAAVRNALIAWRVSWFALYEALGIAQEQSSSLLALTQFVPDPDSERTTTDIARGMRLAYPGAAST